jgi:prepilin-type N-terminal cleavage/methylation domain-containing protein
MVMHRSESTTFHIKPVLGQDGRQVVSASPGFTLIELIMVIVLISILAVSVVPKFMDTSAISLQGGAAMVVADIRYTQELAMSTHAPKTITFATDDTFYTVNSQTMNLPSRVSISSGVTFTFNSLGEPAAGGGSSVEIQAGSSTKTITVESYTGRVSSS